MKGRKKESQAWEWRESKTVRRQDELRAGDQILATLRWEGCLSLRAFAASPKGQWAFDRPRLLSRDAEVRMAGTGALVGIVRFGWTGDGVLELVDGRTFSWGATNFWQTRWVFWDAQDRPLIRFWDTSPLFETTAQVGYWPSSVSGSDRALLTLLGRYLMVLRSRDTAAVAAAAVAG